MPAQYRHFSAKFNGFGRVLTSRNLPRGPIGTANPRGLRGGSRFRISRHFAETAKTSREVARGKPTTATPIHRLETSKGRAWEHF